MRKDELNAISGPNEFAEFYNRLKQIKEFHRKHPNEVDLTMLSFTQSHPGLNCMILLNIHSTLNIHLSIPDLCAHVSGV